MTPLQKICEETIALRKACDTVYASDEWEKFYDHTINHAAQMARACLVMQKALKKITGTGPAFGKYGRATYQVIALDALEEVDALFSEER